MRKHLFSKTSCYFVKIKSVKMQHSQNSTRVLIEIEKLSKATSRRLSFGYTRKKYFFFPEITAAEISRVKNDFL